MERGDLEISIVKTLLEHRDLSGPAVHVFVALYSDPVPNNSGRKLAKLLGYHRNTIGPALKLLESKGLVKVTSTGVKLVNIMAGL